MLTGCTREYLGGTPREGVRACDTVHLLGRLTHRKRGARHCTGALGELAPPEGYSTSTHAGFLSCGLSLRVRPRSDADALADTAEDADTATLANTADDAPADAPADTADARARANTRAHAHANNQNSRANARAEHRRAGRRSVGYELS